MWRPKFARATARGTLMQVVVVLEQGPLQAILKTCSSQVFYLGQSNTPANPQGSLQVRECSVKMTLFAALLNVE